MQKVQIKHTQNLLPPPQEILKSKESKSGFFLGVEGNLGEATISHKMTLTYFEGNQSKNSFVFDGGLKLGYQHYFNKEALGVSQAYGLNVGLYVGAGNPASADFAFKEATIGADMGKFSNSYLPIKGGVDINFLWDFLERGEHTLGLTAGIGYRFGYYLSTKNTDNYQMVQMGQQTISKKFKNIMSHDIYPQIGLHYYYGNHQFDFNYRFGGILSSIGSDVKSHFDDPVFGGGMEQSYIATKLTSTSYFTFGYSYRF